MTNKNEDVVYFSINDWFQGRDYPVGHIFERWVGLNSPLSDGAWCKENKICVKNGSIDMSQNWCVSAPRSFVEKYCPELLTDEEYSYDIIRYYRGEEIKETYTKKFSDFTYTPDEYGDVYDRFDWLFLPYNESNFGVVYYDENEVE